MRVAVLSGSLGPGSANESALVVAESHLGARGVGLQRVEGLGAVPPFQPDLVDNPPSAVRSLRLQLGKADGLLLAAPEYAGGLSGVVKNALDWLVGSATIYHLPVAVMSVGTTGGQIAIEQLVKTLSWQGALVVGTLGVSSPRTKIDGNGVLVDATSIEQIQAWSERLLTALTADPKGKLAIVTAVVEPFGVDASRFGDLN